MYANLRVEAADGKEFFAWEVDVREDGTVLVKLDNQDSGGRDAEPAGLRKLAPPVTISADF